MKPTLCNLIDSIDKAILADSVDDVVAKVKDSLETTIRGAQDFLPKEFTLECKETYARHLVYADPEDRYTIMAMVWGKGQGTPLHDHDGLWVVECVYRGQIEVTNYDLTGMENGLYQFEEQTKRIGRPGESDYRIPPVEYHIVRNAQEETSISLHVFGGKMVKCLNFEPVEGGFEKRERILKPSQFATV